MMNRDLMARQMFANGGAVPSDVQAIVNGLYDAMRGSNADVRQYVQENRRDLSDIAQMFPQFDKAISQVLSQRLGPQSPAEGAGAALMAENSGMGQMMTPVDPPQGGVTQEFIPPGPDGVDPGYGAQNNAPLSQEDLDTLGRMQRNQDRERQEQESFGMRPPPPPPPAALPGIPMAMGGEPMAAAMDQMGADPMAGMMGGEPMAAMMGGDPMAAMGAPPSADLGPATTEGIASQIDPQIAQIIQGAAQNFGDPETAENAEQMMNMVRGDQATVEERRMELGEMVGPEDAAQTPESVLTLVQPVLMMASMDTGGIGPMAQEAMNVPVTGEMAGGIMSMAGGPPEPEGGVPPVNFNQGGEVLRFSDGKVVPLPTGPRNAYAASPQLARQAGMPLAAPAAAPAAAPKDLAALAKERAEVYRGIVGGGDAEGDKDLAQAQFYTDLAKFGFSLMQPGKEGENVLAQAGRAANEVGLGQNTLTLMAQQRAARKAADRQLNLAALSASEAEMTADSAADAALAKANAKATFDAAGRFQTAKVSVEKVPEKREHTMQNGSVVSLVAKRSLNSDYTITQSPFVVETLNGKPIIKAAPGVEYKTGVDPSTGDDVYYSKTGTGPWKKEMIGGSPMLAKQAQVKWESVVQDDGRTVVQKVNSTTLEPVAGEGNKITLPAKMKTLSIPGFPGQLFAQNEVTGVVVPVANLKGKRDKNIISLNGNVLVLNPQTGEIERTQQVTGAPKLSTDARGRIGYVYSPTDENPNGMFVPVDGSQPKKGKYKFKTWVNPKTNQTRVVYTLDDGKELYDHDTGLKAYLPPGFVPISDDTAYSSAKSVEQAALRDQAYRDTLRTNLQELVSSDAEGYVKRVFGAEIARLPAGQREAYRDSKLALLKRISVDAEKIAEDTGQTIEEVISSPVNLRRQLDLGTGLWPRAKGAISTAGAAIFNTKFWKDNRFARQFVTQLSLDLRIAAANSPRFAEGEQSRLGQIVANTDTWLTTGEIELGKLRVLKRAMALELSDIRRRLASGTPNKRLPELSTSVRAKLETADIAISNGLRMLQQIQPYGAGATLRNTEQSDEASKAIQQRLQGVPQ